MTTPFSMGEVGRLTSAAALAASYPGRAFPTAELVSKALVTTALGRGVHQEGSATRPFGPSRPSKAQYFS